MKTKNIIVLASIATVGISQAAVSVVGVNTNTDAAYSADASSSDLVNAGAATLSSSSLSSDPDFGPTAHNNGGVGAASTTADITFWLNAAAGSKYSITYNLNTSVNTLGYDIKSIQTIHGWVSNSGFQKNQNYIVEASSVGSADFATIATVAYLPFTSADTTGSSKVNITEDATGILASGVDQIRFTYTVQVDPVGSYPSPTIREIDVHGVASVPEPSSTALLGLGALTLILRHRK